MFGTILAFFLIFDNIYKNKQFLFVSQPSTNSWLWHTIVMGHIGLWFNMLSAGNLLFMIFIMETVQRL